MYPIGPMRINPVQEFEHYFDVWLDGGRDGRLLRVSRDATCNDSPFRLAEALWRFGNPNGAAFFQLKRILATGIGEVVLDWSSERGTRTARPSIRSGRTWTASSGTR